MMLFLEFEGTHSRRWHINSFLVMCRWSWDSLKFDLTPTTDTGDQKVCTMCLLEPLESTFRGKWGINRFVVAPRLRIFGWSECSTHTNGTRDEKV